MQVMQMQSEPRVSNLALALALAHWHSIEALFKKSSLIVTYVL